MNPMQSLFADRPAGETPLFLAPMDGITDDLFRNQVVALGGVDVACTDFLRIAGGTGHGRAAVARRFGSKPDACLTGVQFMAGDVGGLAESVGHAEAVGADYIDLNFGCPAPRVFGRCAGSAMLAKPAELGAIVAAAVAATSLPVCAKIRVGIEDAEPLLPVIDAAAEAGAHMVCIHARRRVDSYKDPVHWPWITLAVDHVRRRHPQLLVIGNGAVGCLRTYRALLAETGCDAVMIGRGALVDPFLFRQLRGGPPPSPAEGIAFIAEYSAQLAERFGRKRGLGRLKHVLRYFDSASLVGDRPRRDLLRQDSLAGVLAWLRESPSHVDVAGS